MTDATTTTTPANSCEHGFGRHCIMCHVDDDLNPPTSARRSAKPVVEDHSDPFAIFDAA